MNYKTISPPRAQRPSKQTNQELATKIIRMANQIKHQYKTHYYYAIAKALSIRVKRVQVCLKKATAGQKTSLTIANLEKPPQGITMTLGLGQWMLPITKLDGTKKTRQDR